MKTAMIASLLVVLLLVSFGVGRAFDSASVALAKGDTDETVINVQVNSADHELLEGYFALGEQGTVMARPGSQLYNFLVRQRGQKVKIVLTRSEKRELSRLQR